MLNTSVAAVVPKEAGLIFATKRHIFYLAELNAFFYGGKFHGILF